MVSRRESHGEGQTCALCTCTVHSLFAWGGTDQEKLASPPSQMACKITFFLPSGLGTGEQYKRHSGGRSRTLYQQIRLERPVSL